MELCIENELSMYVENYIIFGFVIQVVIIHNE